MGARDEDTVMRGPVRLAKTPTDLSSAFPHGGTELGACRDYEVEFLEPMHAVAGEEFGGLPVELIEGQKGVILHTLIRSWDADAIATVFANYSGTSTNTIVSTTASGGGQSIRAGALGSARGVKLIASPENTTDDKALLIYRAVPVLVPLSRMALSILKENVIAVSWIALPNANGKVYQMGKLSALTVTT